jgi:hypothetical protein
LPAATARLARAHGLPNPRATWVTIGSSLGPVAAGVLALLVTWTALIPSLALFGLLAASLLLVWHRGAELRVELVAGWGLVVLGLAAMGSGWAGLATGSEPTLGARGLVGALLFVVVGAGLSALLRSPAAMAACALQAASVHALHVGAALGILAGAALATAFDVVRDLRRGSADERCLAAGRVLFASVFGGTLVVFLMSVWAVPGLLTDFPGGPGVSLTLAFALGAAVALPLTVAGGPHVEQFLLAHTGGSGAADRRLSYKDAPYTLHTDLEATIGHTADLVRELARGVLGSTPVTAERSTRVWTELSAITDSLERLRAEGAGERMQFSTASTVHAAHRCAGALVSLAEHLRQYRPIGSLANRELDLALLQARVGLLRLVEESGAGTDSPRAEAWRDRRAGLESALGELSHSAATTAGSGGLHVSYFASLEQDLRALRVMIGAVDRVFAEWAELGEREGPAINAA